MKLLSSPVVQLPLRGGTSARATVHCTASIIIASKSRKIIRKFLAGKWTKKKMERFRLTWVGLDVGKSGVWEPKGAAGMKHCVSFWFQNQHYRVMVLCYGPVATEIKLRGSNL
ncbi:MAG TPA: hypothetical protein PLF37_06895 [Planctomycetota bacterium]|nr:hypothetical protein [Planctomycetota bacterium]